MQPEEKLAIVLEGLADDKSITEVCRKYNISRDTYYRWMKELKESAIELWEHKKPGPKGQDEFESRLEAEQAYREKKKAVERKQEEIEALKKEVQAQELQKEFAQYQLELEKELDCKKKLQPGNENGS